MPSPFPGMDPYIERPAIWPDFHDSLICLVKAALQPLLRPRFVALGQDRLVVTESNQPIFPDVTIDRTKAAKATQSSATAIVETDVPAVFDLWRAELRQPFIEIIEPAAGNRVVTTIEVLSPDNKRRGGGRKSYLKKREEYLSAGADLVEIDLLRSGLRTVRVAKAKLDKLRPWHYLVAVTRHSPARQEIYAFPLDRRMPRVAIPLGQDDKDVPLDLQAVFTRCWEEGPYPELLRYESPAPGKLTAQEQDWSDKMLRNGGYRTASTS